MAGRVKLDVAGQLYTIDATSLENGSPSRLVQMYKSRASMNDSGCIRVDRPVGSFSAILAMYQTGELHIPMTSCPEAFLNELDYWDIPADMISSCCYNRLRTHLDDQETLRQFEQKLARDRSPRRNAESCLSSRKDNFRAKIWDLVEYTKPSTAGKVYFVLSLLMVILSICVLAYSTEPSFQRSMTNCERLEYMIYTGMEEYHLVMAKLEQYCNDEKLPDELLTHAGSNHSSCTHDNSENYNYFWDYLYYYYYWYGDEYYFYNTSNFTDVNETMVDNYDFPNTSSKTGNSSELYGNGINETDHNEVFVDTTTEYSTIDSTILTTTVYSKEKMNNTRKGISNNTSENDTDRTYENPGTDMTTNDVGEINSTNINGTMETETTIKTTGQNAKNNEDTRGRLLKIPNMKVRILPLVVLETITIVFFTIDIVLRIGSCPSFCRYFSSVVNIADALALVATISRMSLLMIYKEERYRYNWIQMLEYAQLLRSLRLFRIVSGVRAGRVLAYSARRNIKDLSVLILFLIAGMSVFASCLYLAEDKNVIQSIPNGWYWAIITMTTVGYGDIEPRTKYGRVTACLCAVSGVLLLALTVPIFANEFLMLYKFLDSEHAVNKFRQRKVKHKIIESSETGFSNLDGTEKSNSRSRFENFTNIFSISVQKV